MCFDTNNKSLTKKNITCTHFSYTNQQYQIQIYHTDYLQVTCSRNMQCKQAFKTYVDLISLSFRKHSKTKLRSISFSIGELKINKVSSKTLMNVNTE